MPDTVANGLATRVIPCLDVTDGRVVKGVRFVDLRDAGDPVEMAAVYNREGADELVFLDITATSDSRETMVDVVRRTADEVFIPLTVGGGIRSVQDMRNMLAAGADKVSINSAALSDPELITRGAETFGTQCVVVAVDARWDQERERWEVYSHGGRTPVGRSVVDWAAEAEGRGAGEILLTSMDRDGTGDGYDLPLLEAVNAGINIPLIASGGAGNSQHMVEALQPGRADAVLAATIFHFGELRVADVKRDLAAAGLPVRQVAING